MKCGINAIIAYANKVKALGIIFNQVAKLGSKKVRSAFEVFHRMEKEKMRNQIL